MQSSQRTPEDERLERWLNPKKRQRKKPRKKCRKKRRRKRRKKRGKRGKKGSSLTKKLNSRSEGSGKRENLVVTKEMEDAMVELLLPPLAWSRPNSSLCLTIAGGFARREQRYAEATRPKGTSSTPGERPTRCHTKATERS